MPGGDARLAPLEGDPFSEGFVCACKPGRGGLLCEGRQVNVTVGERRARLLLVARSSALPATHKPGTATHQPPTAIRHPPNKTGAGGIKDFGVHSLSPGSWDFYALTLADSFERKQSSLAIEWLVVEPRQGNYSNALMAFNQGAFPRWVGGGWWGGIGSRGV
jgi:hypothetical protein